MQDLNLNQCQQVNGGYFNVLETGGIAGTSGALLFGINTGIKLNSVAKGLQDALISGTAIAAVSMLIAYGADLLKQRFNGSAA